MPSAEPLLAIRDLTVTFAQRRRADLVAVNRVDLSISRGETVAVLGESGSGKSTIGNALLGLAPVTSGAIRLDGRDIAANRSADRHYRARRVQVVFQDPYGSLNPSRTIGDTLIEPLTITGAQSRPAMRAAVIDTLDRVGLPAAAAARYPRNFSGGQRQRIAIARAIIASPALVVCDEPVSGLDLSIQAQVLNLLTDIQRRDGMAYLFISHDIAVVRRLASRVVVLYRGRVVETGTAAQVCDNPQHPYTKALAMASPVADPIEQRDRRQARLRWSPPVQAVSAPTDGCPFVPRCPFAVEVCRTEQPRLEISPSGAFSACHRREEMPALVAERAQA